MIGALNEGGGGGRVIKSLSITRWSRRDDATKALLESYSEILKALETFENDTTKKVAARCEARGLINNLRKLLFSQYSGRIYCNTFRDHSRLCKKMP